MNSKSEIFKKRLFEILEASKKGDSASKSYDLMIMVSIIAGLVPLTMKTVNVYCRLIDIITVLVFLVDYVARFYTSDYKMGVKSYKAYLAYCLTPLALVDMLAVLPILSYVFPGSTFFRLSRIFRVFLILKLVRYSRAMVTITNVLRKVRTQLLAVLFLMIVYILASAMLVFQLEPEIFNNFFEAVYWSTISITTIGYGDISPVTPVGRFVTMLSALVGVAIIALPSGIITAAYMDEVKRSKTKYEK